MWSPPGEVIACRGIYDEDFSYYEYMPAETEHKVIAEAKRAKEMGNGAK